LVLGIGGPAQI